MGQFRSGERCPDGRFPAASEHFGEPFMFGCASHAADLPGTMLEHMMSEFVEQDVEPHEIPQYRGFVFPLFVEEDFAGCSGPAVHD
jgi:hypothetical protein